MVSAWWLLAAFWLGGCLGMLLAALLAASRNASDSQDDEVPAGATPKEAIHPRV